jgi:tetratricopeptide (TPR) repeat protein
VGCELKHSIAARGRESIVVTCISGNCYTQVKFRLNCRGNALCNRFAGYPLHFCLTGFDWPSFDGSGFDRPRFNKFLSMPTQTPSKGRRNRSARAPKKMARPVPTSAKSKATTAAVQSFSRFRIAPAILLMLLTFGVYSQIIHQPFSNYDDGEYVTSNPNVQSGLTRATLRWAITSTDHANWHPLTWLSHTLDWQLFGSDPSGHHFTSLLLHGLNVVLLFFLLARITGSTGRSLLVAAIFAVHPINVESVAWIAERKNVLCTLFFLLALTAYSHYTRRPNLLRYLLAAAVFVLALAAKPMVVTFPFVLLLLDFWPLQRIQNWTAPSTVFPTSQLPAWKIALEKFPFLVLAAADCVLTLIAQHKADAIKSGAKFPLSARLANAIVSYVSYLWKAVWPLHLAVFYPHFAGRLPAWKVLLCGLFLAAMSVWVWRERARRYLIVGWCWFLGMMVPVIGLIQVGDQGMADRYAYLPFLGLFVAAVWGLADLAQNARPAVRRLAPVAAGVVVILLSVLAWRQVRTWQTPYDLWTQALKVDPSDSVAEDVVGSEILMGALNKGQPVSGEAQAHFQKALTIDPEDSDALLNIGADLQARGKIQEAIADYKAAMENAQDISLKRRILTDLGSAYEAAHDIPTARDYYQKALKLGSKNDPTAFAGFARTFTDEQIVDLTRTLATHPTANGYLKLGQLQESAGFNKDAILSYEHALSIDPKLAAASSALGHLGRSPQS